MRKISGCLIMLSFFCVAACLQEVKPILKPAEVDIPTRIANLQKWLDEAVAAKAARREEAKPIQEKLNQVKEKYNRLQSGKGLTAKDCEAINRMLDECSDKLFRVKQKQQNLMH